MTAWAFFGASIRTVCIPIQVHQGAYADMFRRALKVFVCVPGKIRDVQTYGRCRWLFIDK